MAGYAQPPQRQQPLNAQQVGKGIFDSLRAAVDHLQKGIKTWTGDANFPTVMKNELTAAKEELKKAIDGLVMFAPHGQFSEYGELAPLVREIVPISAKIEEALAGLEQPLPAIEPEPDGVRTMPADEFTAYLRRNEDVARIRQPVLGNVSDAARSAKSMVVALRDKFKEEARAQGMNF